MVYLALKKPHEVTMRIKAERTLVPAAPENPQVGRVGRQVVALELESRYRRVPWSVAAIFFWSSVKTEGEKSVKKLMAPCCAGQWRLELQNPGLSVKKNQTV